MISNKVIVVVTAISIFCSIPPYFLWHSPLVAIFNVIAGLLLLYFSKYRAIKFNPPLIASIMLTFVYVWLCMVKNINIYGVITTLVLIPLFYAPDIVVKTIYKSFVKITGVFLLISLLVYFLVTILNVDLPHSTIEPLNEEKMGVYHKYFLLIKHYDLISGFRFYGLFDEPGVVGCIASVVLLIEKFNLKIWYNVVFLLSGIFSFSLVFYFVLFVCIFLNLSFKWKLFSLICAVLAIVMLSNNETINELLFRRVEFKDGNISGYNRTTKDFDDYYDSFIRSSDVWFGIGSGKSAILNEGGASYKNLIVDYGLLFFIFYVFSWGLYFIRKQYSKYKIILSFGVLAIILFQRPFISDWLYVFLIILIPCCYDDSSTKLKIG